MRNTLLYIFASLIMVLPTQARRPLTTITKLPKAAAAMGALHVAANQSQLATRKYPRSSVKLSPKVNLKPVTAPDLSPLINKGKRYRNLLQKRGNSALSGGLSWKLFSSDFNKRLEEDVKKRVISGSFDSLPLQLIKLADIAQRKGDIEFTQICLERSLLNLTPAQLCMIPSTYPSLEMYMPALIQEILALDYLKMLSRKKNGEATDSTQQRRNGIMLLLSNKYIPALKPLAEISYLPDSVEDIVRYKWAADSIMVEEMGWAPLFEINFYDDMLTTLINGEEYETLLQYFGREPAKQYADSIIDFQLALSSCALFANDYDKFAYYYNRIAETDSTIAKNYFREIYQQYQQQFLEHPTQKEVGDWLMENSDEPVATALSLLGHLLERYWPATDSWEWGKNITLTRTQRDIRSAIFSLLDKARELDNGRASITDLLSADFMRFTLTVADNPDTEKALDELRHLIKRIDEASSEEANDLRCVATVFLAFYTGHGLDSPKKALKILEENLKLLDAPGISQNSKSLYYSYLADLYTTLNKKKKAEKYHSLQQPD